VVAGRSEIAAISQTVSMGVKMAHCRVIHKRMIMKKMKKKAMMTVMTNCEVFHVHSVMCI
jgi:hypothetical protein